MDLAAPLVPPMALSEPFTPAMAARAGIGRAILDRLVRERRIVRLVRGVYVGADVRLGAEDRARALALVLGRRRVVVDGTAAWVHGAAPMRPAPGAPFSLEVHGRRRHPGGTLPLRAAEIEVIGGVRCTTAFRTAQDVGRHLAPERALPALDAMLRAGALSYGQLIEASRTGAGMAGAFQLRELAAMADARAAEPAESVLRLRWYDARLPTPTPALYLAGVRLALGLGTHRFAAVLSGQLSESELVRSGLAGWRVLALDRDRLMSSDPVHVTGHLEREFHQHLLSQVG